VSSFAGGRVLGRGGGVEAVWGASATVDGPEIVEGPLSFHRGPQVVVWVPSQGASEGGSRQDGHLLGDGRGGGLRRGLGLVQSHAAMNPREESIVGERVVCLGG
jgi:hypothetical protein